MRRIKVRNKYKQDKNLSRRLGRTKRLRGIIHLGKRIKLLKSYVPKYSYIKKVGTVSFMSYRIMVQVRYNPSNVIIGYDTNLCTGYLQDSRLKFKRDKQMMKQRFYKKLFCSNNDGKNLYKVSNRYNVVLKECSNTIVYNNKFKELKSSFQSMRVLINLHKEGIGLIGNRNRFRCLLSGLYNSKALSVKRYMCNDSKSRTMMRALIAG